MDALTYYKRLFLVALHHSVDRAHATSYLVILAIGVASYFWPGLHEMLGISEYQIGFYCLAVIAASRLVMAPYWVHQETSSLIPTQKSIWDRANTKVNSVILYLIMDSRLSAETDDTLSGNVLEHAARVGDLEVFGIKDGQSANLYEVIPAEYWEDYRISRTRLSVDTEAATEPKNFLDDIENPVIYKSLRVDKADVFRVWPRATKADRRAKERRRAEAHRKHRL